MASNESKPEAQAKSKRKKKGNKAAVAKETADKLRESPETRPGSDDKAAREKIQADARALLEAERKAVEDAEERSPVLPSIRANPLGCAVIIKDRFFHKNKLPQIIYYRENWYCYYEKLWAERTEDDVLHFVHAYLSRCRTVDTEGELIDFVTSRANVSEVCFQLGNISTIPSHYSVPVQHLLPKPKEISAKGKMVTLGQITDMLTGEQWSNQNVFIPNGANWTFNANAKPPKVWMKFLDDLFSDRESEVELLQEWMGYVLSGDTWAQKGVIIQGPKRAGKGIIGHVLVELLGKSMVASPALKALGDNFGLENMVDKRMCLVSDARLSTRQDTMAVIEMLLRMIAGDPIDVTRKNKTALTLELGARVMVLSNSMPQLGDDSDAINSRFLILKLSESFFGREDTKLADKLDKELAGIALWAIEGYKRLIKRGAFAEPASSREAREEWYTENNPISEFIEDCCILDREQRVENAALCEAYKEWSIDKSLHPIPANVLSRKLAAMLGSKIRRVKTDGVRSFTGIGLKSKRAF